ncbi:isoprenylcysteine carboxylmethyltransferase family protein [Maricurvus nonylphenolicus]|uniref:methyltransferase family protein n=1 Tax=Maricurvus nonylphenolicus TaxID=1008307 RepID=UPI0036F1E8B3
MLTRLENKIPPPLVMVISAAAMWLIAANTPVAFLATLSSSLYWGLIFLLFISGLGIGLGGMLSFKHAQTTINPLKPESASNLVSSGIFQYTRNPMYISLTLMLCSWGVYLQSAWAWILVPVFMLYITRCQIIPEERAMQQLFGEEFEQYKMRVRRWL